MAMAWPNSTIYNPKQSCRHVSATARTRPGDWALVTSCDECGFVVAVREYQPDIRPTLRAQRFHELRAAYHARAWK